MKNRLWRYSPLLFFAFLNAAVSSAAEDRRCFAVYSDTQSDHAAHQRIVEAVRGKGPAAVFIIGDLVDDGDSRKDWQAFNRIEAPLKGKSEIFPALGNHEHSSSLYFKNFKFSSHKRWYEVRRGLVRFILLDATSSLLPGSAQYAWLKSALEEKPQGIKFTVVMLHYPVLSSGVHGEDTALKQALMPLFESCGVDIVFSGHEHSYERSFCRGVYYITGGGAGGSLRGRARDNPYSQIFIKSHTFSFLCAGQSALSLETFDESGKLLDSLTLPAKAASPVFAAAVMAAPAFAADAPQARRKLIVFHSPYCQECRKAKKELMPEIESRFAGAIEIEYRDLSSAENYKFLLALQAGHKRDFEITLPVFYMEGDFLDGKGLNRQGLLRFVSAALLRRPHAQEALLPAVDLIKRFRSFEPLAVIAAGLIDGVNPCAFAVTIFFVSFLTLQGYRRREVLVIGLGFVCAVFVTYLLIGLGIFNFLYSLRGFWQAAKITNLAIGALCLGLGVVSCCDLWKFFRSGSAEGFALQLPARTTAPLKGPKRISGGWPRFFLPHWPRDF
jgi:predicted phosphodiesterase